MNPDLDTLATALYTKIDDLPMAHPEWAPERPAMGIAPNLSDAESITPTVIRALLGFESERHCRPYHHSCHGRDSQPPTELARVTLLLTSCA